MFSDEIEADSKKEALTKLKEELSADLTVTKVKRFKVYKVPPPDWEDRLCLRS
jgi:hypothetical protein